MRGNDTEHKKTIQKSQQFKALLLDLTLHDLALLRMVAHKDRQTGRHTQLHSYSVTHC